MVHSLPCEVLVLCGERSGYHGRGTYAAAHDVGRHGACSVSQLAEDTVLVLLGAQGCAVFVDVRRPIAEFVAEGAVGSYIHAGGSVGVLVEVNCETDFVARTDAFQNFVKDICLHIAAANPKYLDREMIPAADIEREKNIYTEQLKAQGKPESAIENIMKGKLDKYYEDMCLMDQLFIKDDTKKISQLLTEMSTETGEKVSIRRFVRYELGEGIEKVEKNFADEVAEQLKK